MIKNYLKIAIRNLYKHKLYSLINVLGLAIGIACCMLIGLYVYNEWSYDSFHENSDRLYRAWGHEEYDDGDTYFNTRTPIVLGPTLEAHIPEVEATTHFYNFTNQVKLPEGDAPISEKVSMVDPSFFKMFDFPFTRGSAESVFLNPGEVVITEEVARRYFGDQRALQKTLSIRIRGDFKEFKVTGIVQNPPLNSSIQFGILIPFSNSTNLFGEILHTSWFDIAAETYVLLGENVEPEEIRPKLEAMMQSVLNEDDLRYTIGLQPLTDIRHNTEMPSGILTVIDPMYTYILAAVALLILLIACVNFMTLSVSRSASRAKEVGIRKTMGAERKHLMFQYWGEALLMAIFALGIGILLAEVLLPWFNTLSETELSFAVGPEFIIVLVVSAVLISLVAGIYPALILSGFRPVKALSGRLNLSADKNMFRKGMVIFQFTLSIALIAATLMVAKQLKFMRSADLGYQKEHVVELTTNISPGPDDTLDEVMKKAVRLKERLGSELVSSSGVEQLSASLYTPVQTGGWIFADFTESEGKKREFHVNIVDHNFVETYGIEVIKGRSFSLDNPADEQRSILVNQALVDDYGWENPIGKRLPGPKFENHEIVGVLENFHYQSMHATVEPLVLTINPQLVLGGLDNTSFAGSTNIRISLRLNQHKLSSAMSVVEESWSSAASGMQFDYTFVDQAVDSQYRQEERLSQIVAIGTTLAILIACMGLFGLASLMIVRRTKEIGVRKVLGASTSSLVLLVNKEFTKLVVIAFVIATPIAWHWTSKWLQDFAYRIDIGAGIFILSGIIALAISWLTVSYQSIKAARINPVESLRNE